MAEQCRTGSEPVQGARPAQTDAARPFVEPHQAQAEPQEQSFKSAAAGPLAHETRSLPQADSAQSPAAEQREQAKQQIHEMKDATERAAADVRQKVSQVAHEAADAAREAGERVQQSGAEAAQELRRRGVEAVDQQKAWAADELSHFSQAVRTAANQLHEEQDHRLADYAGIAADRLNEASDYLRTTDWRRLVDDAEDFGRRRPEMFLGGMFLAGMGIARFLKASRSRAEPQRPRAEQSTNRSENYASRGIRY